MPLDPAIESLLKAQQIPPISKMGLEAARQAARSLESRASASSLPLKKVQDFKAGEEQNAPQVRLYSPDPDRTLPALIFIHGGGFVFGSIDSHDPLCRQIAAHVPCNVLSIEYGLSPEYKFPEPLEQCYQAVRWIFKNATALGIDPKRIAIGGDSAGGNLSAVLCQMARDCSDFSFVRQILIYPATDLSSEDGSKLENSQGYGLSESDLRFFRDCYLQSLDQATDPLASPLLAKNFHGLPPALILTAQYDPLRDDGEFYAKRLQEAGVGVRYHCYVGMIHGFLSFAGQVPAATQALQLICEDLQLAFA